MGNSRGITRRALVKGAGVATAAAALGRLSGCSSDAGDGTPATNVLLILADDMRADLLPFMPFTNGILRREGAQFTSMRCNVPVCQPARAGLLSGQYAQGAANGVYVNDGSDIADSTADALAVWLEREGVTNGMFGKYLASHGLSKQRGWDTWRVLQDAEQEAHGYTITDGVTQSSPPDHQLIYLTGEVSDFVTRAPEPWFALFASTNPHINLSTFTNDPLPQTATKFGSLRWPFDLLEDTTSKPSWIRSRPQFTEEQLDAMREAIRQQVREVFDLDGAISALCTDLRSAGRLDETLIIFASDGGVFYGEQRLGNTLTSTKDHPYDCVARVPCVIRGPGIPARRAVDTPTVLQDITATIATVFGATPTVPLDGVDLRGLVLAPDPDRATLYERRGDSTYPDGVGIVTASRKLNHWPDQTGEDEWEMYDIDIDPGERVNVANDPGRIAERDALASRLDLLTLVSS